MADDSGVHEDEDRLSDKGAEGGHRQRQDLPVQASVAALSTLWMRAQKILHPQGKSLGFQRNCGLIGLKPNVIPCAIHRLCTALPVIPTSAHNPVDNSGDDWLGTEHARA